MTEGLELKIGGVGEKYEVMREKHQRKDGSYEFEFVKPLDETLREGFSGKFVIAKKEDGFYFFFEPVSVAHAEIAQEYGLAEDFSGSVQGIPAAPWESIMGGGYGLFIWGRIKCRSFFRNLWRYTFCHG